MNPPQGVCNNSQLGTLYINLVTLTERVQVYTLKFTSNQAADDYEVSKPPPGPQSEVMNEKAA